MRKLLVMPICLLCLQVGWSQDSTAAVYIEKLIQRIESHIHVAILEKLDTTIYDASDTAFTGAPLTIHTEFYSNPWTFQLEKVIEKSEYRKCITEITVYYQGNQPIRFTSRQWDSTRLKTDFDVYYMNSSYVHCIKRSKERGQPDSDEFLKWCKEFVASHKKVVNEFERLHGKLR